MDKKELTNDITNVPFIDKNEWSEVKRKKNYTNNKNLLDETIEDNKISYETKDPNNFMFNTKEQSTQIKQQKKNL